MDTSVVMMEVYGHTIFVNLYNGFYEVTIKQKDGYIPLFDGYAATLSEKMLHAIEQQVEWYLINREKHREKRTKTTNQDHQKRIKKVGISA